MSERTNSRISRKKAQRQLRMKRILLTASLMVLVAVVSIGGTIAWLQDDTTTITNTFAPTGIDIALTETTDVENNTFDLIPSKSYQKDPVVRVENSTNVDVYLFVKFEELGNPDTYLTYDSALNDANSGWTQGADTDGIPKDVWYRTVPASANAEDREWHLLNEVSNGKNVTVKEELGEAITMPAANTVKLQYTAYAIQTAGFESNVAAAWAQASSQASGSANP